MTSFLRFTNHFNTLYYMLNVIDDILHDYSHADSDRWKKNKKYISEFHNDLNTTITSGGARIKHTRNKRAARSAELNKLKPARAQTLPNVINEEITNEEINKFVIKNFAYETLMKDFINGLKCEIIARSYLTFNNFINTLSTIKPFENNNFLSICYIFSRDKNVDDENVDIENLYSDIADSFYSFCINNIPSTQFINLTNFDYFKEILDLFLDNNYFIENNIFANLFLEPADLSVASIPSSNSEMIIEDQEGGAKKTIDLNEGQCRDLIARVTSYLSQESNINFIITMESLLVSDPSIEQIQNYMRLRKILIDDISNIYADVHTIQLGRPNVYGAYLNNIRTLNARQSGRKLKGNLLDEITLLVNNSLEEYKAIIKNEENGRQKIESKRLKDEILEATGKLTSGNKQVVGEFMKFIAKVGLYINGITDEEITNINTGATNIPRLLIRQINILKYIAEDTNQIQSDPITTKDLDENLINFWKNNQTFITNTKFKCNSPQKYIINNAAPLGSLNNLAFCPYTSILDGMSLCQYGENSKDRLEYGNMNFKIQTEGVEDIYYNGSLIINSNNINKLALSINIKFKRLNVSNKIDIDMGPDSPLEAHSVLKTTLNELIKSFPTQIPNNYFDSLYDLGLTMPINGPFELVLKWILLKGCGDIFQEINAVAKNGGYIEEPKYSYEDIYSHQMYDREPIRFFAANDRPSGTRFMHLLLNCKTEDINRKAFGGYYSENDELIVKHPQNRNICIVNSFFGGKSNKNKKSNKQLKSSKKKRYTKKIKKINL